MNKLEFTNRNLENLNRCIKENGKVELMKFTELTNRLFDAINYTYCCNTLKDKEEITFTKWLDKWNWKQVGNSYVFKRDNTYTDAESLLRSYTKEHNL